MFIAERDGVRVVWRAADDVAVTPNRFASAIGRTLAKPVRRQRSREDADGRIRDEVQMLQPGTEAHAREALQRVGYVLT